jgi:hypothetical protein
VAANVGRRVGTLVGRRVGVAGRVGADGEVAIVGDATTAVKVGSFSIWAIWGVRSTRIARPHKRATIARPLPMRIVFGDKSVLQQINDD